MKLPFEDYSWPFTQHAKVLRGTTTQAFLAAVSAYSGAEVDGEKVAEVLIRNNVLTPNVRDGKKSPWRDYQQVLAELGLIYSTNVSKKLRITTLGNLLVAEALNFQQLVRLQCLRYQYPNGQKEISPEFLKRGIVIKPGVLCLQVLYGLKDIGEAAEISLDECLNFLLPIIQQTDWQKAVKAISAYRSDGANLRRGTDTQRRNIGDWFEFIGQTGWAEKDGGSLSLTDYGKDQTVAVKQALEVESAHFFNMRDFGSSDRSRWFSFFGAMPEWPDELGILIAGSDASEWNENDLDFLELDDWKTRERKIALSELGDRLNLLPRPLTVNEDPKDLAAALLAGRQKQQAATLLHEELVRKAASDMKRIGARVFFDPNSFDLLARWPDGLETAFEAKTLVFQTAVPRIRLAVGQLLEYAFRYKRETQADVELGFIFNRPIQNRMLESFLREGVKSNVLVYANDHLQVEFFQGSNLETRFL